MAAPHRNATMSVDMNLFGSGGGGICSVHYGDAQSMGDGTPKSPKRKADFNQSNAEEEEEDYCSSSFSSCDIDNEDGRKWNVFVGGSSIDESLVQELFGGNRLSMASFCSRPTAPAGPPAVVSPSTSSGSGSCLGGTLHDLFSEGCNRLFNDFQSAVASISIPPPSNISTDINSVNLQQQQQQQHSTPTSNGTATATPIAIAQPNDHHQQQQAELTSSCTTTSLPSSSSSCAASICTFNESNSSPDSLVLSVLTEADIARNQKRILEAEQSRVAALEANLRWAETVALWREEMGPRGVILDCELVDRKQQQQDEDGEDDDDDDISVHEGMVFFCELDGNTDDEEEDEEDEGVDYIDDDDDDFDVEFIYEEEDESDGMSQQQQQQTSQMNAAAATSVENTTFQLNSSSDSCYRYRSIRFSALPPEVHLIEEDEEDEENKSEEDKDEEEKEEEDKCRLPNWTLMALDRMRTQHDMNLLLAPIFAAEHRERIYQQRFAEKAEANGKTDNV